MTFLTDVSHSHFKILWAHGKTYMRSHLKDIVDLYLLFIWKISLMCQKIFLFFLLGTISFYFFFFVCQKKIHFYLKLMSSTHFSIYYFKLEIFGIYHLLKYTFLTIYMKTKKKENYYHFRNECRFKINFIVGNK